MKGVIALIIFIMALFLATSCSNTESFRKVRVPLLFGKIYLNNIDNKSMLEYNSSWPAKDSTKNAVLQEKIVQLDAIIKSTVEKYAKVGGYQVVDDANAATVIAWFTIKSYSIKNDTLRNVVGVKVFKKDTRETYNYSFPAMGYYQFTPVTENGYYYWGAILDSYKKNFPVEEIAELFYKKID